MPPAGAPFPGRRGPVDAVGPKTRLHAKRVSALWGRPASTGPPGGQEGGPGGRRSTKKTKTRLPNGPLPILPGPPKELPRRRSQVGARARVQKNRCCKTAAKRRDTQGVELLVSPPPAFTRRATWRGSQIDWESPGFCGSGRPRAARKLFKKMGSEAPALFEGFPGSPGLPRPPKSSTFPLNLPPHPSLHVSANETALELVSRVNFWRVLHHSSGPTRLDGSRGQVRPEIC